MILIEIIKFLIHLQSHLPATNVPTGFGCWSTAPVFPSPRFCVWPMLGPKRVIWMYTTCQTKDPPAPAPRKQSLSSRLSLSLSDFSINASAIYIYAKYILYISIYIYICSPAMICLFMLFRSSTFSYFSALLPLPACQLLFCTGLPPLWHVFFCNTLIRCKGVKRKLTVELKRHISTDINKHNR